jgi:hypothetical protein
MQPKRGRLTTWKKRLIDHLYDSERNNEQVILLIFDEARNLSVHNCDGEEPNEVSGISVQV